MDNSSFISMENSVDVTIEKIKIQEQVKEAKLKEKRELASLNRSIRDNKTKVDKLKQEIEHMQMVIDNLQCQINVETYQKDALSRQTDTLLMELNKLRTESEQKIASVWDLRADLIEATKHVTDACDIRTLLLKSTGIDIAYTINTRRQKQSENMMINKHKLQTALEKREEAINKRKKLLESPENDDEFIRIKEALRYSEQMIANIKNQKNN